MIFFCVSYFSLKESLLSIRAYLYS
jgi:hypothetical protein